MLLVSWNVAGRKSRLHEQAERVLGEEPDLVCLQEVTPVTAAGWTEWLAEAGLAAVVAPLPRAREGSKPLAVLTAAREPAEAVCRSRTCRGPSGCSRAGGLARDRQRALADQPEARAREGADARGGVPPRRDAAPAARIVLGDLNTPRREHADGTVWTFARERNGRLRADRGERWDAPSPP